MNVCLNVCRATVQRIFGESVSQTPFTKLFQFLLLLSLNIETHTRAQLQKKIQTMEIRCLRTVLGISYSEHITNTEQTYRNTNTHQRSHAHMRAFTRTCCCVFSCPLVKKHADLLGSFLYSQSTTKDMCSKPTNRTELSIPVKTKSLA